MTSYAKASGVDSVAIATERETLTKEIHTAGRHTVVYGMGGLLAKAIGFLMLPFYTHFLAPADYGILEILDLSMSLVGMFLNMGITAALLRSYTAAKSPDEKAKVVSTAFLFVGATALITYVLMLSFIRPVSNILVGPAAPRIYVLLSFSSFVCGYIAVLPRTYLRALEASGAFVGVETISLLLMLVLNVYFIAVLKLGLLGILWSSVAVIGVQAIVLSWWMLRRVKIRFSLPALRGMVRFGLPLILSNLALFALNFSDRFFLQHLRSMEVVGIYAVGYKVGFMMSYVLVQPFFVMWQSRMYAIHAQPGHAKIFGQIFVLYSLLLTYAGLGLSVLSPEFVRVMVGPKFASSQDIIPVVAAAYIFAGLGYYVQVGMFLTNKTSLIGLVSAGAAILNLVLNYVLISRYGMMGAAWATLLSFVIIACGSYYFSQRVFPLPLEVGRVAKGMIVGVMFYLVSRYWSPHAAAAALAAKCALLIGFPVLLWALRIVSPAEMGTLAAAKDNTFAGLSRLVGIGEYRRRP